MREIWEGAEEEIFAPARWFQFLRKQQPWVLLGSGSCQELPAEPQSLCGRKGLQLRGSGCRCSRQEPLLGCEHRGWDMGMLGTLLCSRAPEGAQHKQEPQTSSRTGGQWFLSKQPQSSACSRHTPGLIRGSDCLISEKLLLPGVPRFPILHSCPILDGG